MASMHFAANPTHSHRKIVVFWRANLNGTLGRVFGSPRQYLVVIGEFTSGICIHVRPLTAKALYHMARKPSLNHQIHKKTIDR